ncbi:MAG: hypothetical protein MJZ03_03920 [archaeon]|nr:hypothetical protein [archaeon]
MANYIDNVSIGGVEASMEFSGINGDILVNKRLDDKGITVESCLFSSTLNNVVNSGSVTSEYINDNFISLYVRPSAREEGFAIYYKILINNVTILNLTNGQELKPEYWVGWATYISYNSDSDKVIVVPGAKYGPGGSYDAFNYMRNFKVKNVLLFDSEDDKDEFITDYAQGIIRDDLILNYGEGPEPEPEPEPEDKDGDTVSGDKGYYFQNVQTKYSGKSGQTYTGLQSQYFERYEFDPTNRRIAFYPTNDSLGSANKKFMLLNAGGLPCRAKIGKVTSEWREGYRYLGDKPIYLNGDYHLSDGSYMVSAFSTNIPIFMNRGDALQYVDDGDNVNEAINADSITTGGVVDNKKPSGTDVNIDFQAFADLDKMINYYKLSKSDLNNLSNALWNGDSATVEEATKLIGSNAFNAIASCRFFPMNISEVATLGSARNIHLGKFDTEVNVSTITANSGTKSFGSYTFKPIHGDFRDYTNVKIAIWLPYIGLNELDPHKYMGKTASLDYFVDITSGACQAVMQVNGAVTDSWAGEIGRQVPVTAEDAQSYNDGIRGAVLNARNFKVDQKATDRHIVESTVSNTITGFTQGVGGNVGGAISSLANIERDVMNYQDTVTKMNNQVNVINQSLVNASQNMPTMVCGSAGGFISQRLPQSVYLFIAVNKSVDPQYTREICGKPTSASGPVSMFSGYLSGDVVKVEGYMTDTEREMIATLLKGGIYV